MSLVALGNQCVVLLRNGAPQLGNGTYLDTHFDDPAIGFGRRPGREWLILGVTVTQQQFAELAKCLQVPAQ